MNRHVPLHAFTDEYLVWLQVAVARVSCCSHTLMPVAVVEEAGGWLAETGGIGAGIDGIRSAVPPPPPPLDSFAS